MPPLKALQLIVHQAGFQSRLPVMDSAMTRVSGSNTGEARGSDKRCKGDYGSRRMSLALGLRLSAVFRLISIQTVTT
ncbi:hypothetical protein EYF80_042245 [Liparis tanakae]|uniref:Uncharacterized protein n=1 Tax=Liparis tanakae TaxID=230148 RepID=A0A4Z2G3W9_9TELE|nr:hypothetical protein EYF80_042245 [Liparis tanakae]